MHTHPVCPDTHENRRSAAARGGPGGPERSGSHCGDQDDLRGRRMPKIRDECRASSEVAPSLHVALHASRFAPSGLRDASIVRGEVSRASEFLTARCLCLLRSTCRHASLPPWAAGGVSYRPCRSAGKIRWLLPQGHTALPKHTVAAAPRLSRCTQPASRKLCTDSTTTRSAGQCTDSARMRNMQQPTHRVRRRVEPDRAVGRWPALGLTRPTDA